MTDLELHRMSLEALDCLQPSAWEVSDRMGADTDKAITALRERLAQPEQDWDWRHPKAQALIGAKARLEIKLRLIEQLLEDPHFETTASDMEYWEPLHDKLQERLAQPEQEPFFTEANGFPQTFVSKDRQKQAIISLTDQCAALMQERDELQKQVWLYEKNGVTCQTYRHTVEQSCVECNVQMNYTTPPRREWVGLTDEEVKAEWVKVIDPDGGDEVLALARAIEAKLKEKNAP